GDVPASGARRALACARPRDPRLAAAGGGAPRRAVARPRREPGPPDRDLRDPSRRGRHRRLLRARDGARGLAQELRLLRVPALLREGGAHARGPYRARRWHLPADGLIARSSAPPRPPRPPSPRALPPLCPVVQ